MTRMTVRQICRDLESDVETVVDDALLRVRAIQPPAAVEPLCRLYVARKLDPESALILGSLGDPAAGNILRIALLMARAGGDFAWRVAAAADALGILHVRDAGPELLDCFRSVPSRFPSLEADEIRMSCALAMAGVGFRAAANEIAGSLLHRAPQSAETRDAMRAALRAMRPATPQAVAKGILSEECEAVRWLLLRTLGYMDAVPALAAWSGVISGLGWAYPEQIDPEDWSKLNTFIAAAATTAANLKAPQTLRWLAKLLDNPKLPGFVRVTVYRQLTKFGEAALPVLEPQLGREAQYEEEQQEYIALALLDSFEQIGGSGLDLLNKVANTGNGIAQEIAKQMVMEINNMTAAMA